MTLGGAALVPFFKQGPPGRDMNNNDCGNAACKNQTNITLIFLCLLYSSYLVSAFGTLQFFYLLISVMLMKSYFYEFVWVGTNFSIIQQFCVNCEMRSSVHMCVCSCHIRIRICVMSDVVGVNDYAVTAAVNLSDRLGGMNTCDRHRARRHVRKTHGKHTNMPYRFTSTYK